MSRTLSQIYSQTVAVRNKYMQLTNVTPSTLSNSKLSILGLMTYVVSVVVYSYETILDTFEVALLGIMNQRMMGTANYYLRIAKLFQFNELLQIGDPMTFDEDTLQMKYDSVDDTHRIITHAAYQYDDASDCDMILKVCKASGNGGEEGYGAPLTDEELTAFKHYIDDMTFVGTKIKCISCPGDILYINSIVYYDDSYITADQAASSVKEALVKYVENLDYNAYVYYQAIIDAIQAVENIKFVDSETSISVRQYNPETQSYGGEQKIRDIFRLYAGYAKFIDENDQSTLTTIGCNNKMEALASTFNLKFVPQSSI